MSSLKELQDLIQEKYDIPPEKLAPDGVSAARADGKAIDQDVSRGGQAAEL